jgi:hypothetical protein
MRAGFLRVLRSPFQILIPPTAPVIIPKLIFSILRLFNDSISIAGRKLHNEELQGGEDGQGM